MSNRQVYVTSVNYYGGSTATATGVEVETGERITFAGDHRPMRDLADALSATPANAEVKELPGAEVPGWAILSRSQS